MAILRFLPVAGIFRSSVVYGYSKCSGLAVLGIQISLNAHLLTSDERRGIIRVGLLGGNLCVTIIRVCRLAILGSLASQVSLLARLHCELLLCIQFPFELIDLQENLLELDIAVLDIFRIFACEVLDPSHTYTHTYTHTMVKKNVL